MDTSTDSSVEFLDYSFSVTFFAGGWSDYSVPQRMHPSIASPRTIVGCVVQSASPSLQTTRDVFVRLNISTIATRGASSQYEQWGFYTNSPMTNTDVSGQMPHRAVSPSLPQVEILDQVCLQVRPPDLSRLVQTCNHLHDVARHQLVLQHTRVDDRFQLPFACIFDHRLAWIAIEAGASVGLLNLCVKEMVKGDADIYLTSYYPCTSKADPEAITIVATRRTHIEAWRRLHHQPRLLIGSGRGSCRKLQALPRCTSPSIDNTTMWPRSCLLKVRILSAISSRVTLNSAP